MKIFFDLLRHNREFALGIFLTEIILIYAAISPFAPYSPELIYVVPPDLPPSWTYWFGTSSRGQDVFWQLSFAMRNTLLFGFTVAIISRVLSLVIGLVSGYLGGITDRVLMSITTPSS